MNSVIKVCLGTQAAENADRVAAAVAGTSFDMAALSKELARVVKGNHPEPQNRHLLQESVTSSSSYKVHHTVPMQCGVIKSLQPECEQMDTRTALTAAFFGQATANAVQQAMSLSSMSAGLRYAATSCDMAKQELQGHDKMPKYEILTVPNGQLCIMRFYLPEETAVFAFMKYGSVAVYRCAEMPTFKGGCELYPVQKRQFGETVSLQSLNERLHAFDIFRAVDFHRVDAPQDSRVSFWHDMDDEKTVIIRIMSPENEPFYFDIFKGELSTLTDDEGVFTEMCARHPEQRIA